jgi:DNA-directed RNA polymerase specialized sigma24 family protein
MKKRIDDALRRDVEGLLELSVISEAMHRVQQHWEDAFSSLDAQSQELLHRYFEGIPLEELSRQHAISIEETEKWVTRAKRQLNQHLRTRTPVKQ